MSSIVVNQYTNVGFYKAPVSKSLLLLVGGAHAATHVPALHQLVNKIFTAHSIDSIGGVGRYILSKLIFPDTRTAFLACCIFYFFRIFERRYGSTKFSTNVIISFIISISMEVIGEHLLDTKSYGPFGLIMPLFIPWYFQIPLISASHFGPLSISSKTFPYLLGVQLALTSRGTQVASVCGLLTGLLVHCTSIKRLVLPSWVSRIFSLTWEKVIASSPPQATGLMGATLEIQRTQQTEALEQQMLRARNRFNVPMGGRQMRLEEMWGEGGGGVGGGAARHHHHHHHMALPPASPVLVQTLTDMGFPRDRVEQALRQTGNNLDEATNLLLQDM